MGASAAGAEQSRSDGTKGQAWEKAPAGQQGRGNASCIMVWCVLAA